MSLFIKTYSYALVIYINEERAALTVKSTCP